ncbi:MAG: hypothetical protein ABIN24_08880 [Dyadobacter sp.]
MIPFYLFLVGCYLYYTRSKYFPVWILRAPTVPGWSLLVMLIIGIALNINREGWASGLLLSVVSCSLAVILIQFTAVLGKKYFYSLAIFAHALVLIDLLS